MAEFVLHVPDLDEAGKAYDFPVRKAWLAEVLRGTEVEPDPAAPEGTFHVHAQTQGADLVIAGRVRTALVVPCARCLEPARVPVDAEIASLLTARGEALRPEADERELTPEEISREFFSGDDVVLDDVVREHLLLEIPIKPLCAEDCAGIAQSSPHSDAKPHIDPRLAPLLKLVGKVPTQE